MNLTAFEMVVMAAAIMAVLMTGSTNLKLNLSLYAVETLLIGIATSLIAYAHKETGLYFVAIAFSLLKGAGIPIFLNWMIDRIKLQTDNSTLIAPPLAMHLTILLLGLSYLFVSGLPIPNGEIRGWPGATAATSLLLTGLVFMITRRAAISQIVGFLVLENGIYLFALTQTRGMPMIVEMGVLLDVLVGVMIAGMLVFRIQSSFEHIDVSQLSELKD